MVRDLHASRGMGPVSSLKTSKLAYSIGRPSCPLLHAAFVQQQGLGARGGLVRVRLMLWYRAFERMVWSSGESESEDVTLHHHT